MSVSTPLHINRKTQCTLWKQNHTFEGSQSMACRPLTYLKRSLPWPWTSFLLTCFPALVFTARASKKLLIWQRCSSRVNLGNSQTASALLYGFPKQSCDRAADSSSMFCQMETALQASLEGRVRIRLFEGRATEFWEVERNVVCSGSRMAGEHKVICAMERPERFAKVSRKNCCWV